MPSPMALLPVIMPSFNHANYIREAIDSVLSQTDGPDVELIVVDGGSTDGTQEILTEYGPAIRWISPVVSRVTSFIRCGNVALV